MKKNSQLKSYESWNDLCEEIARRATSRREFANNIGIPQSSLSGFLNLTQPLKEDHLIRLAEILEANADELRQLYDRTKLLKPDFLQDDGPEYRITPSSGLKHYPGDVQKLAAHSSKALTTPEAALDFLCGIAEDEMSEPAKIATIYEVVRAIARRKKEPK